MSEQPESTTQESNNGFEPSKSRDPSERCLRVDQFVVERLKTLLIPFLSRLYIPCSSVTSRVVACNRVTIVATSWCNMDRLNKAQLKGKLQEFRETPPSSWTCPELRQRPRELNGVYTSQQKELHMLHVMLSGNETVAHLETKALNHLHETVESHSQDVKMWWGLDVIGEPDVLLELKTQKPQYVE